MRGHIQNNIMKISSLIYIPSYFTCDTIPVNVKYYIQFLHNTGNIPLD